MTHTQTTTKISYSEKICRSKYSKSNSSSPLCREYLNLEPSHVYKKRHLHLQVLVNPLNNFYMTDQNKSEKRPVNRKEHCIDVSVRTQCIYCLRTIQSTIVRLKIPPGGSDDGEPNVEDILGVLTLILPYSEDTNSIQCTVSNEILIFKQELPGIFPNLSG